MSRSNVTVAVGFIDLATYDCVDGYLYGGPCSVTYFVRSVKKANWFSIVPVSLRTASVPSDLFTTPAGTLIEFQSTLNRSGDYILNVWLRVGLPLIRLAALPTSTFADTVGIRYTHNFMHNLVESAEIHFNELISQTLDSAWFDFNHYFRTPGSKKVGYDTMIGNVASMYNFVFPLTAAGAVPAAADRTFLGTGGFFDLPLPFWFTEDSGLALPIASLPFNDVTIHYTLRALRDLIVVDVGTAAPAVTRDQILALIVDDAGSSAIGLTNIQTFAHYAVVHQDERCMMGTCPRDIVFTQIQWISDRAFDPCGTALGSNIYDLKLSHPVMFIAFAARNTTIPGEWSNYAVLDGDFPSTASGPVNLNGFDPIAHAVVTYENTARVDMGADYYSLIVPWYWCPAIPDVSGIHGYSYALRAFGLDPSGSTNYSKLANVSKDITASAAAAADAVFNCTGVESDDPDFPLPAVVRSYTFIMRARNWNVHKISGGSIGLPVL